MKNDLAPSLFFGATMVFVVTCALVISFSPDFCSHPAFVAENGERSWCFEFWLYRYQTLLGGLFTLIAAATAAVFVVRQTRVARQQLDVMIGDIDPSFFLTKPKERHHGFELIVANENRSLIQVQTLELLSPTDVSFLLETSPPVERIFPSNDGRRHTLNFVVQGTRPAAGAVNTFSIRGIFIKEETKVAAEGREVDSVVFRVTYIIMKEFSLKKSKLVKMEDARVGMTYYSNEKASGVKLLDGN